MRIQYRTTGHVREVHDGIGARLVSSRIARMAPPEDEPKKPPRKRAYKRRDMVAEGE